MKLEIRVCAIGGLLSEDAKNKILEAVNDTVLEVSFSELCGICEEVHSSFISLYEFNQLVQSSDKTGDKIE